MEKTLKELKDEIHEHSQKGISLFKEGREIHEAYLSAPEEHNLVEEVSAFIAKESEGTAELTQAADLRTELIDQKRAAIANTIKDLRTEREKT